MISTAINQNQISNFMKKYDKIYLPVGFQYRADLKKIKEDKK